MTGPEALAFPDRRTRGVFPVRGPDGVSVAEIGVTWTGTGFTATDTAGARLCAGRSGGFSPTWRATGPDERPLLTVRRGWTGSRAEVVLERGGTYELHGSAWRQDFAVRGPAGTPVVEAVAQRSAWSFTPYDYVVRQTEPTFDLAELVAVVQIWRMIRRGDVATAGAAAVT